MVSESTTNPCYFEVTATVAVVEQTQDQVVTRLHLEEEAIRNFDCMSCSLLV